ncbi:hypothetical protein PR048_022929 [Dryococelus australis]|uniref:Uncharacterized protein n=1 Tax=Dryococelus australis TaxID=614101 RepID=A0ABQ9GSR9_9NEOP|nr:hypothetical protein PR048_022929 [Dryococelus australis]
MPQKLPTTLAKNRKHELRHNFCSYVEGIQGRFGFYESEGGKKSGCKDYDGERKGVKRGRLQCNEINRDSDTIFDCRKDIKLDKHTYFFTIDKLVVELSLRIWLSYFLCHYILENIPGKLLKHIPMM